MPDEKHGTALRLSALPGGGGPQEVQRERERDRETETDETERETGGKEAGGDNREIVERNQEEVRGGEAQPREERRQIGKKGGRATGERRQRQDEENNTYTLNICQGLHGMKV